MLKTDTKEHYKMYKSGKQMVNAMLLSALIATGGLALSQTAKADTVENASSQPTVQTMANSAAQATNQTVANSAVSSTVPASQVSTAPSSVTPAAPVSQPSQAASSTAMTVQTNTFKVSQNNNPVMNLNQKLVQNTNQNQVSNLSIDFINDTSLDNHQNDTQVHGTVVAGRDYIIGMKGSFDVDSNLINKDGQWIKIGELTQTNNPNTNDTGVNTQNDFLGAPLKYKGQTIGYFDATGDQKDLTIYFRPTANLDTVGQIHIEFNLPNSLLLSHNSPASNIVGNNYPQDHIFKLGNATFTLTLTSPQYQEVTPLDPNARQWTNDSNASPSYAIKSSASLNWYTAEQFNSLLNSNGQSISSLPDNYQYGAHIVPHTSILGIKNYYGTSANPIDPVTHKRMYSESGEPFLRWAEPKNSTRVAENKSVAELKAMNIDGLAYSYQSDGSINMWVNLSRKELTSTPEEWDFWSKSTYYQTLPGQTTDAVSKAIKEYYEDGVLHGLPTNIQNQICLYVADPTIKNSATITYYDSNLSTDLNNNPAHVSTTPASSMASGQSAVKLHVINAQNGADLKHLIHFIISLIV